MNIQPGSVFNTKFETDCIAKTAPDADGNFDGWDSDNVLCQFSTAMVTRVGEIVAAVEVKARS